ncbi:MAG: ABC transporter substrate-binding protein [Acidobacteria bacterium]|jgi:peptide/nickel transport system substrate-binding protein|nr:ABC transporter substrate-binding protein [Acidobacteriota bacterium]
MSYRITTVLSALLVVLSIAPGCHSGKQKERTLYVAMSVGPVSRDPLRTFDEVSQAVLGNVFQSVMPGVSGEQPGLGVVSRWVNPDMHTWDLFVRPSRVFHDGRPVLATDVDASIRTAMSDPESPLAPLLRAVVDVRAIGDDRVRISTSGPTNLVADLAFVPVVPQGKHVTGDETPVGSGPYRVVRWVADRRIVLRRVATAAAGTRPPDLVEFVVTPDAESARRVLMALDPLIMLMVEPEILTEAEKHGFRRVATPTSAATYLVCNLRPGRVTAQARLRRAIAAAADPAELIRRMQADEVPADDFLPSTVFGHVNGRYHADPRWLDDRPTQSSPLELVVMDTIRNVGVQLTEVLQGAGFDVHLNVLPVGDTLRALSEGRFDLSVIGYGCTSGSGLELYELGFTDQAESDSQWNFSGYRNPRVDSLVAEAKGALDPAVQHRLLVSIGDEVLHDLPWIPLFEVRRSAAVSPSVRWTPAADGRFLLLDVEMPR